MDLTVILNAEMLALVPVIAVLLQVLKKIPVIAKFGAWMPFVAIAISYALLVASGLPTNSVMPAIIIGLTASGSYDLVKAPTK